MLLLAGGVADPNLDALDSAATSLGVPFRAVRVGTNSIPAIRWHPFDSVLHLAGESIDFDSAFIRYDVFEQAKTGEAACADVALAWYSAIGGYCAANPRVRLFNRSLHASAINKLAMLGIAAQVGLKTPATTVTNCPSLIPDVDRSSWIVKPSGGGSYCLDLPAAMERATWRKGVSSSPAIVQEKLRYPEYRVFLVCETFFVYEIHSEHLDYRLDRIPRIRYLKSRMDRETGMRLLNLAAAAGLDFAAFDFKTCPKSGDWVFLEANSAPMFAGFDACSDGDLSKCVVQDLTRCAQTRDAPMSDFVTNSSSD